MEKWLKERVLHRYIIENFKKYHHDGLKIIHVKDNKDQFPDLFCVLEDGKEVPVEIEWQSSNFVDHRHDINYLKENQGFVCYKNQDSYSYAIKTRIWALMFHNIQFSQMTLKNGLLSMQ